MKKKLQFKQIMAIITGVLFSALLVCLIILNNNFTYAAPATIQLKSGDGVVYYVTGEYVTYDKDSKTYGVTKDSNVTIHVINDYMVADKDNNGKMIIVSTVNGNTTTEYASSAVQTITFAAKVDTAYSVATHSRAITPSDYGKTISSPYTLYNSSDFLVLYDILQAGSVTSFANNEIYKNTFHSDSIDELKLGYYKVMDNLVIEKNEFYGFKDFGGVFDFNNNSLTINVNNTAYSTTTNNATLNAGLFASLTGSTTSPVVIRNGSIRGSIALSNNTADGSGYTNINLGGIAGNSSGTVIYDSLNVGLSLTVNDNANINIGGFFGVSSTPIQDYYNLVNNGIYSSLQADTNKAGGSVTIGGFAGTYSNAYIYNYTDSSYNKYIIANSSNASTGNVYAGGFIGSISNGSGSEKYIKGITLKPRGDYSISSSINNTSSSTATSKVASAGVIANVSATNSLYFDDIYFERNEDATVLDNFNIIAKNTSSGSRGDVYAGGLYGIVNDNNAYFNEYRANNTETVTLFTGNLNVEAIQNGYNEAYAGGMFAYGAFKQVNDGLLNFTLTPNYDGTANDPEVRILASQSASSVRNGTTMEDVEAGYYSSTLPTGYKLTNFTLTVNNSSVTALRDVGSKSIGNVFAGGLAGSAQCSSNGTSSYFYNITINLVDSSVNALSLSFDSNLDTDGSSVVQNENNNMAAGGFLGHMKHYGKYTDDDDDDTSIFESGDKPGAENIYVNIDLSKDMTYVIRGVQNAVSGNSDHCTEGYVGGLVGYTLSSSFKNVYVNGDSDYETIFHLSCNNSPNTSAAGGLIGENNRAYSFAIDGAEVNHIKVVNKSYYEGNSNSEDTYDAYCGGAIGVIANNGGPTILINDIKVSNTNVEVIGENYMFASSGGIAGGLWWAGTNYVTNCYVLDSDIYAMSMYYNAYSGGAFGLVQGSTKLDSLYIIDSNIHAYTGGSNTAYSAGLVGYVKYGINLSNNYVNSYISAEGTSKEIEPIYGRKRYGENDNSDISVTTSYYDPFKIYGVEDGDTINSSGFKDYGLPVVLYTNNGWYSSHTIENNTNYAIYSNHPSNVTLSFVGDDVISANGYTVKRKANNSSGITYATLTINVDGQQRIFASYPIIVSSASTSTFKVYDIDGPAPVELSPNYSSNYYIQVRVGDEDYKNLQIAFDGATNYTVYNPSSAYGGNYNNIISNLGSEVQLSNFVGKIDISVNGKYIELSEISSITERTIVVFKIGSSYVVVDYIPNYVTGIDVVPSDDTPALGTTTIGGKLFYMFAPSDTINIVAKESYSNTPNTKNSDATIFTYNYVTVNGNTVTDGSVFTTDSNAEGYSNGTFVIGSNTATRYYKVTGKYSGNGANGSIDNSSFYIMVVDDINYSINTIGASYEANRKAILNQTFEFSFNPDSGYGLEPTMVVVKNKNDDADLTSAISFVYNNGISVDNGTFTADGYTFAYDYNPGIEEFTIRVPGNLVTSDLTINISYDLVYELIFDRGYVYSTEGERYFTYTVRAGTKLDMSLLEQMNYDDNLYVERFGYSVKGYYMTDSGKNIESYGEELLGIAGRTTGNMVINGPIYFYARWTYQAIIEHPDGVEVKSTLDNIYLQDSGDDIARLIPINANTQFKFTIKTEDWYEGTPTFKVYSISKVDGTLIYTDITEYCKSDGKDGWIIDQERIDGIVFIKVFNSSAVINDGESEETVSVDTEIHSDSVFTINYALNYSTEGVTYANAALSNDIVITFASAKSAESNQLPAGTVIRLYRHVNGKEIDVSYLVLNSASSTVSIYDFTNIVSGQKLSAYDVNVSNITSENYYLIVTLPNESTAYAASSDYYFSVSVTYNDVGNINKVIYDVTETIDLSGITYDTNTYYSVKTGKVCSVNKTGENITVTIDKDADDIRHEDYSYVIEVYSSNGFSTAQIAALDAVFDGDMKIVETNNAVYYLVSSTTTYDVSSITGVTVSVIEVTDTKSPASGVVIYQEEE